MNISHFAKLQGGRDYHAVRDERRAGNKDYIAETVLTTFGILFAVVLRRLREARCEGEISKLMNVFRGADNEVYQAYVEVKDCQLVLLV